MKNNELIIRPCDKGEIKPVVYGPWLKRIDGFEATEKSVFFSPQLKTGSILANAETGEAYFHVVGKIWLPGQGKKEETALLAPLLEIRKTFAEKAELMLEVLKSPYACAIITLSDKGAQGLREDRTGPAISDMLLARFPDMPISRYLLEDEMASLKALLVDLALVQKISLIVTNGGTGVGPRDITPQVTLQVIDYELPGFSAVMNAASFNKTPNAIISRSVCGVLGRSLIINVPGSLKGATENLAVILPALAHALDKLNGDMTDCGG